MVLSYVIVIGYYSHQLLPAVHKGILLKYNELLDVWLLTVRVSVQLSNRALLEVMTTGSSRLSSGISSLSVECIISFNYQVMEFQKTRCLDYYHLLSIII